MSIKKRLIARLDIKGQNLVKGIHMEGLRVIGNPESFAKHYYDFCADELLYIDSVASLYGRNSLANIIEETVQEIFIPFAVGGVIPNYVREDKIALLLDAGLNRIRMGIQSGSNNILEFYKRPTKLHRIKEATEILNKFKKYMIPPAYDIILENPVETPEDTRATVDMLYEMPRPYTLNIYALRIIPNTTMAKQLEDRRLRVPPIDKNYFIDYQRTLGNCLVFALTFWKMPQWLYKFLRKKVYPVQTEQSHYPILFWF